MCEGNLGSRLVIVAAIGGMLRMAKAMAYQPQREEYPVMSMRWRTMLFHAPFCPGGAMHHQTCYSGWLSLSWLQYVS